MRNTRLDETQLESRLQGKLSTSAMQMTPHFGRKSEEELKSLSMKVKEESEKAGLKFNIQKTKIMTSGPIILWQKDEEKVETVTDFIFLCSKTTADCTSSNKIKRCLLLGTQTLTNLDSVLKS